MKVTILGSGTCVPSLMKSSCSVLIEIADKKLLFDSGAGTIKRLLEANTTIFDITHIFFSHFHPDHTAEFVPFLFASKYSDKQYVRDNLTILASKGFKEFYEKLKAVYGNWIELPDGILNIIELDNKIKDSYEFKKFKVESIPVCHNEESISYKITDLNGASVVYSGDTDYSQNLETLAKNVDLLICESSHPDELKTKGHMTPSIAGKIATNANVKKLILTHMYPECDNVDLKKQARQTYKGEILIAKDLMEIEIL